MTTRIVNAGLLTAILAVDPCPAGEGPRVPKKHMMDEREAGDQHRPPGTSTMPSAGGLNWVLVDTMQNAYGMLSNRVDPLSFDPVSGYVGLIHRGKTSYAAGSGELWYNTSPDGINLWSRIASLNCSAPTMSRYPSATIASGAGAGSELFAYSAPQLNPGAFGFIIFGVDPLNAGVPFCVEDPLDNTAWSNTRIAADDDSPHICWCVSHDPNVANVDNAAVHLWCTSDYGSILEGDIWDLSIFQTRGLEIGLAYRNGVLFLGGYASLVGDPNEVMNVFYSKSTDDGVTWTEPDGPFAGTGDWRELPAIAASPYDDWETHMSFDMLVDVDGFVHIFGVLEDTDNPDANLAVVEIFETLTGWDARFVSEDLAASTITMYGTVDQMGFHVGSSINADGTAMATAWLSAAVPGDTLPDIWVSSRQFLVDSWGEPINITNTPDYAELLLQVAPILRDDGNDEYTMFMCRGYEQGILFYPPNDVNPADIFCTGAPVTIASTNVPDEPGLTLTSNLEQNYPNPFNSQTEIRFQISDYGLVRLAVYDLLGREITTLVNEPKDAGSHNVSWDAAGLPSGIYCYRLQTGGFVETKKIVLLR